MSKAVLDTNIIVSGLLTEGNSALVLKLAESRIFRCYVSNEILLEYEEVLYRRCFRLEERHVTRFMSMFRRTAELVVPKKRLQVTKDPDDNIFLECALEARADYVVTGNLRHFPPRFQDIRTVSARQFLASIAANPY